MHDVQARIRLLTPFTCAFTGRRFTFQRRLVTLLAWLMLFPNCGPLPQISHTRAMTCAPELISCSNQKLFREAYCRRDENLLRKIQSIRELVEIGKARTLSREQYSLHLYLDYAIHRNQSCPRH